MLANIIEALNSKFDATNYEGLITNISQDMRPIIASDPSINSLSQNSIFSFIKVRTGIALTSSNAHVFKKKGIDIALCVTNKLGIVLAYNTHGNCTFEIVGGEIRPIFEKQHPGAFLNMILQDPKVIEPKVIYNC